MTAGTNAGTFLALDTSGFAPERAHLPLWLLDIDGVLNAFRRSSLSSTALTKTLAALPGTPYLDITKHKRIPDETGRSFYNMWSSRAMLDRIVALHDANVVEIAWLTTWMHTANANVAPRLDLPSFPVASFGPNVIDDYNWKYLTMLDAVTLDRPLIWTDDDEVPAFGEKITDRASAPTLCIAPNAAAGLLVEDIDAIELFCRTHTA